MDSYYFEYSQTDNCPQCGKFCPTEVQIWSSPEEVEETRVYTCESCYTYRVVRITETDQGAQERENYCYYCKSENLYYRHTDYCESWDPDLLLEALRKED